MDIMELKEGLNDVNVEGKLLELEQPTDVVTKYGSAVKRANGLLEDDTGKIKITLWGEQASLFKEGDTIKIENGYVKSFRGELQLSVGKKGKIEKV